MIGVWWTQQRKNGIYTRRFLHQQGLLVELPAHEAPLTPTRLLYTGYNNNIDSTTLTLPTTHGWTYPIRYDGETFIKHRNARRTTLEQALRESLERHGPLITIDHTEVDITDEIAAKRFQTLIEEGLEEPLLRVRVYSIHIRHRHTQELRYLEPAFQYAWDDTLSNKYWQK